jgi:SAM-dependent methyltransferase
MTLSWLRYLLHEPEVRGLHVDDNQMLVVHALVVRRKKLLRSAFKTFYIDMAELCDRHLAVPGLEVELGTGAGFFKSLKPSLLTSDVRVGPGIDMELNAQAMALQDSAVRCIYAINVFHHLSDPARFFEELVRVLRPGGGCILIEPHCGFVSAFFHRYLHDDEHFNPAAPGWRTVEIEGPLSGANQALADIVFRRDLHLFEKLYGNQLEIVHRGYELNAFRYLLSGGVNFRQLVPSFMEYPLAWLERLMRPLARAWSLHQIIVIRRRL